ncbi:MAG: succinate dehydrogenase, hydrophobic membrane anchor protein [Vannielia sp.]|uniref:succinate dehydrogenase, hydrophobic membrane anchor protein n=1 Tax=Rhodobacterales TaxID=204455 RepID=UPI002094769D|nr:succinate dehydrogenase, hydrophobic membrane anchor protein [Oceanicola sp. 502str15]MCO6383240.1 succinate dehydrogenase, hydrophobic membrane anchor protein [Oceanicola sp. 502str15]
MKFITDRKRATGLGSGSEGTAHHWKMMASSLSLVILVPLFVFLFGSALGRSFDEVQSYFANPFITLALGIGLTMGLLHIKMEIDEAVEDYVHGLAGKLLLMAVAAGTWVLIAAGLLALIKLAL